METLPVTFGWVTTPTAPAQGTEPAAASARTATLLQENHAFIEALPAPFTTLWFEDHFQWGADPTLECLTTAAYCAARYPRFALGTIVLGQGYRNPALTAKMAASLYALSGGRFILGLGAGWKQDEHDAYGYAYPSAGIRIDQLEEAVRIVKTMFTEQPASFSGSYYHIHDAYCEPRPSPSIPVLIGGNGNKTLRVAAAHADMWNGCFLTTEEFSGKKETLARLCRGFGRDPQDVQLTYFSEIDLTGAHESASPSPGEHFVKGDPQQIVTELQTFIELGVRHFMFHFSDFPSIDGLKLFTREVIPALGIVT
jgi:alkanesulfonate monooxygenase SsuD/methylene tetrahydromethanopterin reductase-like flavin-dependent oxidoreductase (luciferase family)